MSKEKLIQLNSSNKKSNWLKDALYRKSNRKWLNYSSQIARRILAVIDEDNLTQSDLAKTLDVSRQQVSKIIKGQENLSLQTIAKLSEALRVELISFPEYKFSSQETTDVSNVSVYSTIMNVEKSVVENSEKFYVEVEMEGDKTGNILYVVKRSTTTSKIPIAHTA